MNLHGPVRADESVGTGKAAVTLSMTWKGVSVATTTHTLEVSATDVKSLPLSPRFVRSLPHPDRTASLSAVRFMPDGRLFAAGYPSGVVQLWDVTTAKEVRKVQTPRGYRGTSDYALAADDFKNLYVPIEGGKSSATEKDGKKRYKFEYSGEVRVWELKTGEPKAPIRPEKGYGVIDASVSPDGSRMVTVERTGYQSGERPPPFQSRLYDLTTHKSWSLGEGYAMAAFSPDGSRIYVALMGSDSSKQTSALKVFDRQGKELETLGTLKGAEYLGPVVSPDGKLLAVKVSKGVINQPGGARVFDLKTKKVIASFDSAGDHPFIGLTFSPDGERLAATDFNEGLTVWDVTKNALIRRHVFKGMGMSRRAVFDRAGKRLAISARVKTEQDGDRDPDPLDFPQPRVYLFDLATKGEPEEIVCPHGWNGALAFSNDDKLLAVGGAGAVHLFDLSKPVQAPR